MRGLGERVLPYLRSDDDLRAGRSRVAVAVRMLSRCARQMAHAARSGRGSTRIRAPYWMARHMAARATRPIRSNDPLMFTVGYDGREHRTLLRKAQSDIEVWREVFVDRDYDFAYEHVLGEVVVIVDLGANAGLTASYFQMRFPNARIVAVEPLEENVMLIRANADLLGVEWDVEQVAIGAVAGSADFYASEYWNTGSLVREIGEYRQSSRHRLESALALPRRTVDVVTVAQFLDAHQISQVSILKMDIEGAERAVLADATGWLHRVGVLIVELHAKYFDAGLVREQLWAAGFVEQPHPGSCSVFVNPEFATADD
jgi:FkbM family methyltransferase